MALIRPVSHLQRRIGELTELAKESREPIYLTKNGTENTFYTMPGGHDFTVWKHGLYNFARRIFK